jgi:D-tyrosyl-tRNA(Tyr) deacylase
MRCLIQRVTAASVEIDGTCVGEIAHGFVVLVCAMQGDTEANADKLARKVTALRVFRDDAGKMNRSIRDVGGAALVVSQFTLAADTSRGNRPGFSQAAAPELGEQLYRFFCDVLRKEGIEVQTGQFGADMRVTLTNDGPVTVWMEM